MLCVKNSLYIKQFLIFLTLCIIRYPQINLQISKFEVWNFPIEVTREGCIVGIEASI